MSQNGTAMKVMGDQIAGFARASVGAEVKAAAAEAAAAEKSRKKNF